MITSNRLRLLVVAFCAAAAALCAPAVLAQTGNPAAAHPFAQSKPVAGNYIVVFKNSVRDAAAETANVMNGAGGQVLHVYLHAIKGFAATLPDAALQAIRNNPNVSYIEADQTALPLDSQYHFNDTGAGVHAFIIDTGIRATHTEFGVRFQVGQNFVGTRQGRTVKIDPADTNDCNGHGTHVSGT